jgi:hypothetical protein
MAAGTSRIMMAKLIEPEIDHDHDGTSLFYVIGSNLKRSWRKIIVCSLGVCGE